MEETRGLFKVRPPPEDLDIMRFTYTRKAITESVKMLTHFRAGDQFIGFAGSRSSGSLHDTINSDPGSGCPVSLLLEFRAVGSSSEPAIPFSDSGVSLLGSLISSSHMLASAFN
jgi:hypothetical protein